MTCAVFAVESDTAAGTVVIVEECEITLEESNGLSEALESTGVVVEGAGEGYMGLYRWP